MDLFQVHGNQRFFVGCGSGRGSGSGGGYNTSMGCVGVDEGKECPAVWRKLESLEYSLTVLIDYNYNCRDILAVYTINTSSIY